MSSVYANLAKVAIEKSWQANLRVKILQNWNASLVQIAFWQRSCRGVHLFHLNLCTRGCSKSSRTEKNTNEKKKKKKENLSIN